MLGRAVDQILPCPGDPVLREPWVRDARAYVELAEAAHGPIPRPVDFAWPWGEALAVLDAAAPDVRVVNLETSVTRAEEFAVGKDVHYRMNPDNLPCLTAVRPDVCVLANNHTLDFGREGLRETLDSLAGAGLRVAGAGADLVAARRPACVPLDTGGRVLVFAFGMPTSGIPPTWAAGEERSGVDFVRASSPDTAAAIAERVRQVKRPGDIAVASVHWGSNWGYGVPRDDVRFAHDLVDAGVDIVHGHSSHHPRPLEVRHGKLVLYGCGDLIDDYEGISGYERFRDDLRLLYLVSVDPGDGTVLGVRMIPLQARRMRLGPASVADTAWLRSTLDRVSRPFGSRIDLTSEGMPKTPRALTLRAPPGQPTAE